MPYVGSYVWEIRQKIGHDLLIIPSVDVIAVDEKGRLLLIRNKDTEMWSFPGGYVEKGQSLAGSAIRELYEEAGLRVDVDHLEPFASVSGYTHHYPSGDVTQPYLQAFVVRQWEDTGKTQDTAEIQSRQWVGRDDLTSFKISLRVKKMIEALDEYAKDKNIN